jgi:hypothetical protein
MVRMMTVRVAVMNADQDAAARRGDSSTKRKATRRVGGDRDRGRVSAVVGPPTKMISMQTRGTAMPPRGSIKPARGTSVIGRRILH